MNFKKRLTNVFTAAFSFIVVLAISGSIYDRGLSSSEAELEIAGMIIVLAGCFVIPAMISFLMGTGFKAWHKE